MDNFHRLIEINSHKEQQYKYQLFNWRSELYDTNDNTYFLLAKFALLNKLKIEQVNVFFNQYFSIDIFNLNLSEHRSLKYLFSIFSNKAYIQNNVITKSSGDLNILGIPLTQDYYVNTRHCPECIKSYKLPEHASLKYLDRCLFHNVKLEIFPCNHLATRLNERSVKCYLNFIKFICPNFPSAQPEKPNTAGLLSTVLQDLDKWNFSLKENCDKKLGKHIHTFKSMDCCNPELCAHFVLVKELPLPESLREFTIPTNAIRKINSVSIFDNSGFSFFENFTYFQHLALPIVYSSFCYLHRRNEASFIQSLLSFFDELKLDLMNKTEKFWYLHENDGIWTFSNSKGLYCGVLIHDLLIDWLTELWLPPFFTSIRSRRLQYFNNFHLMNEDLVKSATFIPVKSNISENKIDALFSFNRVKFQEFSIPNFSSEQMLALDSMCDELVKSYIYDARVWLNRIESGEKPDHFPPKSRALLSLQKVQNQYRLFNVQID
jgi:hypothetical protein